MSQENVELASQVYDAFNRRDSAAFLELMDADVEALPRLTAIEGGYHGHDGIRRWWRTCSTRFRPLRSKSSRFASLASDAHQDAHQRPRRDSDSPLEETNWVAIRWRDKKVVWWGAFATEAEALEAVGMSE